IILSSFALICSNSSEDILDLKLVSWFLELYLGLSSFLKQSLQYTGLSPVGLNGTWHSFLHLSQITSCIFRVLFSGLLESLPLNFLLPRNFPSPDLTNLFLLFDLKFPIFICLNISL